MGSHRVGERVCGRHRNCHAAAWPYASYRRQLAWLLLFFLSSDACRASLSLPWRSVSDCGNSGWRPGDTALYTVLPHPKINLDRTHFHCYFEPFTDWEIISSSTNVVLRLMPPARSGAVFAFSATTAQMQGLVVEKWPLRVYTLFFIVLLVFLLAARRFVEKSFGPFGGAARKRFLAVAAAAVVSLFSSLLYGMKISEVRANLISNDRDIADPLFPTPLAMFRLPNGVLRMYYRSFAPSLFSGNLDAQYVHVAESYDDGFSFQPRTDIAEVCVDSEGAESGATKCRKNDIVFGGSKSAHNFGISLVRMKADDAKSVAFVAVGGATADDSPWLNIYTSHDGLHGWKVLQPLAHSRCGFLDTVNRIIYDDRARVYRVFSRFNAATNRRSVMTMFCSEPSLFQCYDAVSNRTRWSKWYAVDISWANGSFVGEREEIYWPGVNLAPGSPQIVLAHAFIRQKDNISSAHRAGSGLFSSRNGGVTWQRVGDVEYIIGSDLTPWVSEHTHDLYAVCPFPEFIRSRDSELDLMFVSSYCSGTSNQSFVYRFSTPRGRWGFAAPLNPDSAASLVSSTVKICNNQLSINIRPVTVDDDRRGAVFAHVRVALLDAASNKTIAGFALHDCIPLTVDSTSAVVRWRNDSSLQSFRDRRVRIRFEFAHMLIFGFQFIG